MQLKYNPKIKLSLCENHFIQPSFWMHVFRSFTYYYLRLHTEQLFDPFPIKIIMRIFISIFFTLFCLQSLCGQNTDKDTLLANALYSQSSVHYTDRELDKAIEKAEEALAIYKQKAPEREKKIVNIKLDISNYKLTQNPNSEQIPIAEELVEECKKLLGENHKTTLKAINALGSLHLRLSNHEQAISIYKEAASKYEQDTEKYGDALVSCYNNLGIIHKRMNLLDKAVKYQKMNIDLTKKVYGESSIQLADAYTNIATNYDLLGDFKNAVLYNQRSNEIIIALHGENSSHLFANVFNQGIIHSKLDDWDEAELSFLHADKILKLNGLTEHVYQKYVQTALAHADYTQKEYKKAYKSFIDLVDSGFQPVESLHGKGLCESGMGNYEEALNSFSKSRIANGLSSEQSDDFSKILIPEQNFQNILETLVTYKKLFLTTDDTSHLEKGLAWSGTSLQYVDYVMEESGVNTNLKYSNDFSDVFWNYAHLHILNDDHIAALQALEKNRASILLESVRDDNLVFKGADKVLLDSIASYKKSQKFWANEQKEHYENSDSLYIVAVDSFEHFKSLYTSTLQKVESESPEYFALNYGKDDIDINRFQESLSPDDLVIEYAVCDSAIISIAVSNDKVFANCQMIDKIEVEIDMLRENILESSEVALDQIANILLEQSIPREANFKNICFITQGPLQKFPFEILPYQGSPLIENYNVSYATSMKLLDLQMGIESEAPKLMATFAPSYEEKFFDEEMEENQYLASLVRDGELALPGAHKEASRISEIFNGDNYLNKEANKKTFLEQAGDYKILHLAMHSSMDELSPYQSSLIFSKEDQDDNEHVLYLGELYNLDLNADLAVLSACNTGFGKSNKGEGMMSISNAFAYAGVPSIIQSLWKVPDQSTSLIMESFYQYLNEGLRKDHALRLAKIDYLNDETISDKLKSPHYWAGFIASGNMDPIKASKPWIKYLMYGCLALLFFGFIMKKIQA